MSVGLFSDGENLNLCVALFNSVVFFLNISSGDYDSIGALCDMDLLVGYANYLVLFRSSR